MSARLGEVSGCALRPLEAAECEALVSWLRGEGAAPEGVEGLAWALGHFDDGVTWCRLEGERWRRGDEVAPALCPAIRRERLQELRLFGEGAEILIWRSPRGLRGRRVSEAEGAEEALRPSDRAWILRGDQVEGSLSGGFTQVVDGSGAGQVLPLVVTAEQLKARKVMLHVKHHYQRDAESGAVRVALTRLVKVGLKDKGGRS
jgi:CRISPR-associated protein (TIGR03984 family)